MGEVDVEVLVKLTGAFAQASLVSAVNAATGPLTVINPGSVFTLVQPFISVIVNRKSYIPGVLIVRLMDLFPEKGAPVPICQV